MIADVATEAPTGGRLLLIRHGESTWNAEHRWAGHADPPLSDAGRTQANALARRLAAMPFDRVVTSDLERAAQTAAIIADVLNTPAPTTEPRLRERSCVWSGLTSSEIDDRFPGQLEAWRAGRLRDLPAGSEEWESFVSRVDAGIRTHLLPGQTVLGVTHAGVFRAVEALFDVPFRRMGNADGQWLHLTGETIEAGPPL